MAAKIMKKSDQDSGLVDDLERFLDIMRCFQDHSSSEEELEMWKYRTLIQLMDELEDHEDKEFVKNALIIITVLFKITPADLYDSVGFELSELTNEKKEECLNILLDELLPN